MLVTDARKFWIGLIGLVTFFVVLAVWVSPVINGKTGLEWADDLFNQLAKNSAYYIPEQAEKAAEFEGTPVDATVKARSPGEAEKIARLAASAGAETTVDGQKVKIKGDLGRLSEAALADADALHHGQEQAFLSKYGMSGREVVYYWWTAFKGINKQYLKEDKGPEANYTKSIITKGLEPAYNFAGFQAAKFSERAGVASFLLVFYLIYTIWYGFSIWYLFEGLGVVARAGEKKEA